MNGKKSRLHNKIEFKRNFLPRSFADVCSLAWWLHTVKRGGVSIRRLQRGAIPKFSIVSSHVNCSIQLASGQCHTLPGSGHFLACAVLCAMDLRRRAIPNFARLHASGDRRVVEPHHRVVSRDLEFIRDLVKDVTASGGGRPGHITSSQNIHIMPEEVHALFADSLSRKECTIHRSGSSVVVRFTCVQQLARAFGTDVGAMSFFS